MRHPRSAPKYLCFIALGALLAVSCKSKAKESEAETSVKIQGQVVDEGCPHSQDGTCSGEAPALNDSAANQGRDKAQVFGEALGSSPEVELAQLLSAPTDFHDKTIQVQGHVRRVCARKGCWMEISSDEKASSASCRVTFKDYGFLVPVDSKGTRVKLEGLVQLTRVKKAAVDHYESEGASFRGKEPDGSAHEVRLIATGVELTRI